MVPFPVVDGISPELPGRTEIIWRHARNVQRMTPRIQLKILTIGPDIGAVERNVDRNIAKNADPVAMRIATEILPLAKEFKLPILIRLNFFLQALAPFAQRPRLPRRNLFGPLVPDEFAVPVFVGHEQREIIEPVRVVAAEFLEFPSLIAGGRLQKPYSRFLEQRYLPADNRTKLDRIGSGIRVIAHLVRLQKADLH